MSQRAKDEGKSMPGFTAEFGLVEPRKNSYASSVFHQAPQISLLPQVQNTGGHGTAGSCDGKYMGCAIKCNDKYPPSADSPNSFNETYRDGCLDSCKAALDLCQAPMRINRRSGIARAVPTPVAFLGH